MTSTLASAVAGKGSLPSLRWAMGGWAFFIAENAILSENRSWIISQVGGDDPYHLFYGTMSTVATASIGYSYFHIRKVTATLPVVVSRSIPATMAGWVFLSTGLIMASQAAPKMQIPVGYDSTKQSIQVKCPFDFSDKRGQIDGNDHVVRLQGLERISRHAGLWSLGFCGLGQACLATSLPMQVWWTGPAMVAWLGGAHTDSRFRRGLGGTLSPEYDAQTSNIPFWAMISGQQSSDNGGTVISSAQALAKDTKLLNAALAVGVSSLWVLRKVVR